MNESQQSAPPENTPKAPEAGSAVVAGATALPWYRRPLFWGVALFLGLLLLAAWLFWKEWQEAEASKAAVAAQTEQWREHNAALESFMQQLRALLAKDPCEVKQGLGLMTPPAGVMWPPLAAGGMRTGPPRYRRQSSFPVVTSSAMILSVSLKPIYMTPFITTGSNRSS